MFLECLRAVCDVAQTFNNNGSTFSVCCDVAFVHPFHPHTWIAVRHRLLFLSRNMVKTLFRIDSHVTNIADLLLNPVSDIIFSVLVIQR